MGLVVHAAAWDVRWRGSQPSELDVFDAPLARVVATVRDGYPVLSGLFERHVVDVGGISVQLRWSRAV